MLEDSLHDTLRACTLSCAYLLLLTIEKMKAYNSEIFFIPLSVSRTIQLSKSNSLKSELEQSSRRLHDNDAAGLLQVLLESHLGANAVCSRRKPKTSLT